MGFGTAQMEFGAGPMGFGMVQMEFGVGPMEFGTVQMEFGVALIDLFFARREPPFMVQLCNYILGLFGLES